MLVFLSAILLFLPQVGAGASDGTGNIPYPQVETFLLEAGAPIRYLCWWLLLAGRPAGTLWLSAQRWHSIILLNSQRCIFDVNNHFETCQLPGSWQYIYKMLVLSSVNSKSPNLMALVMLLQYGFVHESIFSWAHKAQIPSLHVTQCGQSIQYGFLCEITAMKQSAVFFCKDSCFLLLILSRKEHFSPVRENFYA